MKLNIPHFDNKDDLFKYLKDNESKLIAEKCSEIKHADAYSYISRVYDTKGEAVKSNEAFIPEGDFVVKVVINTTNILDSHSDVHIPSLWKESLNKNNDIVHLQEHRMRFANVISRGKDLKAYTKVLTFKEIGFDYEGNTEALIFESTLRKSRNEYMYNLYANGEVTQHSVGMRYRKLVMCVNSEKEYYGAEKEAWDKYYPMIANKEVADSQGYFWAVTEAEVVEGSAVVLGSNKVTPTLDNNLKTQKGINYKHLIDNFKL